MFGSVFCPLGKQMTCYMAHSCPLQSNPIQYTRTDPICWKPLKNKNKNKNECNVKEIEQTPTENMFIERQSTPEAQIKEYGQIQMEEYKAINEQETTSMETQTRAMETEANEHI